MAPFKGRLGFICVTALSVKLLFDEKRDRKLAKATFMTDAIENVTCIRFKAESADCTDVVCLQLSPLSFFFFNL